MVNNRAVKRFQANKTFESNSKTQNFGKFFLVFLGALILGGGLVLVGFLIAQGQIKFPGKAASPTSQPELTPITTRPAEEVVLTPTPTVGMPSNWKTYTNSKYAYRFKYPSSWVFTASIVGDESKPLYVIRESINSKEVDGYLVSVRAWANPDNLSLTSWLQFMEDSNALPLPAEGIELVANFTVGGEPAFKIWSDPLSKGKEPGKCVQACPNLSVYFTHKSWAYMVQLSYTREVDEASQETFDQILSTFQFLD
jgi:hypothetical protein